MEVIWPLDVRLCGLKVDLWENVSRCRSQFIDCLTHSPPAVPACRLPYHCNPKTMAAVLTFWPQRGQRSQSADVTVEVIPKIAGSVCTTD